MEKFPGISDFIKDQMHDQKDYITNIINKIFRKGINRLKELEELYYLLLAIINDDGEIDINLLDFLSESIYDYESLKEDKMKVEEIKMIRKLSVLDIDNNQNEEKKLDE